MANEKRRSDRILLTIPLTLQGEDENGVTFHAEAHTSMVSRHGARIHTHRQLRGGQKVCVMSQLTRRSAEFRIVGLVAPFTERGGEYGVECLNHDENIWGIQFPPLLEGETVESKAVLECRNCHAAALIALSLVEAEVLETSGILTRTCETCGITGPWGHAEKPIAMAAPAGERFENQETPPVAEPSTRERRRYRRVALQLPVRIRNYYGGLEVTRSENISKGGFCFVSEKDYQIGEGVLVTCPYHSTGENIEVRARVVSCRTIEGSPHKVYGVQYSS